jgi:hypothetical protein
MSKTKKIIKNFISKIDDNKKYNYNELKKLLQESFDYNLNSYHKLVHEEYKIHIKN